MLSLSTIELRNEISFRFFFIDQDKVVLLLTLFDKTYVKDILLILNYIKKKI